ncbi:UNVERIFIED_CONTAM: hypothetical protein FKN15_010128 [Acipenser sinensis]
MGIFFSRVQLQFPSCVLGGSLSLSQPQLPVSTELLEAEDTDLLRSSPTLTTLHCRILVSLPPIEIRWLSLCVKRTLVT